MKLTIREPWWSAAYKFNWPNRVWGIGIKKEEVLKAIESGEMLEIHIEKLKENYVADPQEIKEYVDEKKSKFIAGKKTILYVVPKTLLTKKVEKPF